MSSFLGIMSDDDIRRFWPDIAISLDSVPRFNEVMTKDFLLEQALAGSVQFWAAGKDSVVELFAATKIVDYPSSRALQVVVLVGRNLEAYWHEGLRQLDRIAQELLCDEIEIETVRPGLAKRLEREADFEVRSIALVKRVERRIH